MSQSLYRNLRIFRDALSKERDFRLFSDAYLAAKGTERLSVVRTVCKVSEDWIEAVERGVSFIANAIDEERQFIRSEGDILPIEKVKRVSRESVQHLARHSNLITKEQKGEELLPDKLYTVERLNDYATYENRFLFYVLTMAKEFVNQKYNRIEREKRAYRGEYTASLTIAAEKRKLFWNVSYKEEREEGSGAADPLMQRAEALVRSINFYLKTPLMAELAKEDKMISVVTKTNIMRMDANFKEAVLLYEFLISYDKEGYSLETERVEVPLSEETRREFALSAAISSFLARKEGLGLNEKYEEVFRAENALERENTEREAHEKLARLREKVGSLGGEAESYLLSLEEYAHTLEGDSAALKTRETENAELQNTVRRLSAELEECRARLKESEERREAENAEAEIRRGGGTRGTRRGARDCAKRARSARRGLWRTALHTA